MTPADFVQECRSCVMAGGAANEIAALLRPALAAQREDPSWCDVDEFMHRSTELLLVNLTLPAFTSTPIHDHGMWAVIGISSGCEVDRFYVRDGSRLREHAEITLSAGRVIELSPQVIHAISNPLPSVTRGIHVYGGDLVEASRNMWDPRTGEELAYDGKIFEAWCDELTQQASSAAFEHQRSMQWDL